ncbi:MAG TPA: efflux RND transporter periplasmic adaptor subunit [Aquabacterium sp.]|nr:efflux RND transporter periplasmic adaptor subunit [Aquabacterium sp.]
MNKSNSMSWFRKWRWLIVALVVLGSAWGVKRVYFTKPAVPQVITAKAKVEDIEDTVLASGTIQAAKEVSVGAQVSGQIKHLYVDLGDHVKKGQLVAEIDSTTQNNNLRNAEAQVALLKAQRQAKVALLKQAELTYRRKQELVQQDAGSKADMEAAEATLQTTRSDIAVLDAQLRQASIAVDTARVNLGYTRITAPIDGVVVAVIAEEGRTVNAIQTAPSIIKLAKLDQVQIKAQISEADVVRVKPGMPAYFTILGEPLHRYETTLRGVEPVPEADQTDAKVTASTSTTTAIYYNGLFDVPNPDGKLRALMTAQVFIVLNKVSNALVIPASALGKRDRQTKTYEVSVLEGGPDQPKIVTRQVKIGLNNRVQAQVLSGLKEGDQVVVGEATGSGSTGMRRPPGMF